MHPSLGRSSRRSTVTGPIPGTTSAHGAALAGSACAVLIRPWSSLGHTPVYTAVYTARRHHRDQSSGVAALLAGSARPDGRARLSHTRYLAKARTDGSTG